MTRRLYVSDVHLMPAESLIPETESHPESPEKLRLRAFSALLRAALPGAIDEIYVLGDLCEMWIGDDDDNPLVQSLTALFSELSQTLDIKFVAGNRDFLLGNAFAKRTGIRILSDPQPLGDGTLVSHGDNLCTDDAPYQQMRTLLRSKDWQREILSKSLDERRAFGAGLRAQSKAANANKASNIMDVNPAAVSELFAEHSAQMLIHGHTHRPGVHHIDRQRQRVVLGAWERCGWWAIQNNDRPDQKITLRCAGIAWLSQQRPAGLAAAGVFN